MRRQLRNTWPSLSYHFGIHPWDVDRLTFDELRAYQEALDDLNREAAAAKAKAL